MKIKAIVRFVLAAMLAGQLVLAQGDLVREKFLSQLLLQSLENFHYSEKKVNDDFKLVTFDLVADPSTKGAFPALVNESVDSDFIKNTIETAYSKALSERVFITLLKKELRKK